MERKFTYKRIFILAAVLLTFVLLLCSCRDTYDKDFYITVSSTNIKYGETITVKSGDDDTYLGTWEFNCSEDFEITNKTSEEITVSPKREGTLYLQLFAKDGPQSQIVKVTVSRQEQTITTADELMNASDPSVRYVLGGDIDMSGVTSFTPGEFKGALDGKGFAIKNFTYTPTQLVKENNLGFWSNNEGVVENVVFDNTMLGIYSEAASAGIVAGVNNGIIRNVTVKGLLSAEMTNNVGGVCGINNGTVLDCTSEALVEGKELTGGIAGTSVSAISGSKNLGVVEGTVNVGGIVGKVTEACTISGNDNSGEVSGTTKVGGVIGSCEDNKIVQINSCENNGEVSGTAYVGGVIGTGNSAVMFGCKNFGMINAISNYVGGIGGKIYSARRCENAGAVNAAGRDVEKKDGYYEIYVAGIAGYVREISECSNHQRITMTAEHGLYIGGVAGYLDGLSVDTKLNNNYNEGEITTAKTAKYVGGVIGYMTNASLRGTVNEGDVNGGSYTAGAVGYIKSGGVYFTTNKGAIKAGNVDQIAFVADDKVTIFNSVTEGTAGARED